MAKKMMAKTRIEKANVTRCTFCGFGDDYELKYNEFISKATEKNPDKNYRPWWRIEDEVPGVPGYRIITYRTERERDSSWNLTDGLYQNSSFEICENCMGVINKCFTNLGEAEEISYARKETKVFPMPEIEDCVVKEEE